MVGGISPDTGRHFHPPRLRHYLTKTSEVHVLRYATGSGR